jgi:hypothetical protein
MSISCLITWLTGLDSVPDGPWFCHSCGMYGAFPPITVLTVLTQAGGNVSRRRSRPSSRRPSRRPSRPLGLSRSSSESDGDEDDDENDENDENDEDDEDYDDDDDADDAISSSSWSSNSTPMRKVHTSRTNVETLNPCIPVLVECTLCSHGQSDRLTKSKSSKHHHMLRRRRNGRYAV